MEKILVLYGGKSVEHDISIITALQAMNSICGVYDFLPVYVTHEGEFVTGDNLTDVNIYSDFYTLVKNVKYIRFNLGKGEVLICKGRKQKKFTPSAALVCMHGLNGEDGAVSGLMQLCQIPYTCPSVQASSTCMDKETAKIVLAKYGVPVCDYVAGENIDLNKAARKLKFPIIVKPSRCGSSIGIKKCENMEELKYAVEIAKFYDKKVILEHFLTKRREFNCACMISNGNCTVSKVCEVKSKGLFDFDEKYLNDKPISSFDVEKRVANKVKLLTEKTCLALGCDGVVRVDFLMDENANLMVNEVNTIPGSLAFYLFSSMKEIVIEMIEEAKERFARQNDQTFFHPSKALNLFANSNMNKYAKK